MSTQVPLFNENSSPAPSRAGHVDLTWVLAHLDTMTEAEGGLQRLRGLVLDLAVRGRLTDPAFVDTTSEGGATFGLPATWRWMTGREVFTFVTSGSRGWAQYYSEEGPIFIRIGNLDYHSIDLDLHSVQRVRPPADAEGTRTKVQPGDVLISITGDTGMVGLVPPELGEAYINQHIALARPGTSLLPAYIARALTAPTLLGRVQSAQRGIKNSLGLEDIRDLALPVPPLAEQKRIVGKVDELMRLIDDLEAKQTKKRETQARLRTAALDALTSAEGPEDSAAAWKRVAENFGVLFEAGDSISELRQTLRTLAVRGALVPQRAGDGSGQASLARMRAHRNKLATARQIRGAPQPDVRNEERLFLAPESWAWARFGDIGDWGSGATPNRARNDYYGGTIPWFKSGELNDGLLIASQETITDKALTECSLRRNAPGDVLVAMYGATIGKTAILAQAATTNQAVCACTPFPGISNAYLLLLLQAYKPVFVRQGAGGAQPNISKEKIVATAFPLPPEPEQARIVAKVDQLMKLCDDLEAKLGRAETTAAKLVEAVVAEMVA